MLEDCGFVLGVEVFYCECFVLTSNSRSGSKFTFHTFFANYFESFFTNDDVVNIVADIHYSDPYPLIGVGGVAFFVQ